MKDQCLISGFSFVRNADRLGYPVVESIRSVLPVCDEYVIAVGEGDSGDRTRDMISSIGDPKIRIIDTRWENFEDSCGRIYSEQTNIALDACKGTWCFYLQCDEVLHERDYRMIRDACLRWKTDGAVEGFRFNYRHFLGDYSHFKRNHRFYAWEVRIVRNGVGVRSVGDAQSFKTGSRKLRVVALPAWIFHYGYVRDPRLMAVRMTAVTRNYSVDDSRLQPLEYSYPPLGALQRFGESHPAVMKERIAAMNWGHLLDYSAKNHPGILLRLRTWLEQKVFDGTQPWGFRSSHILRTRKWRTHS